MHRPQPGDRDVGVQLRGRQAGMTEQLLDHPQVGATFQQVGRRAVPQPVRPHIGCAVHRGHGLVHRSACLPHVKAPAPGTQQQRVPGLRDTGGVQQLDDQPVPQR
ncbi:Uncharacterised protein [Mycobacterium tuberculosis]|uniref:Uncharacterized protein n=1 Tax=Mycobacterium tuberculosis TaxID=1773 RepID=A0A916LGB1_MYCTX|nr:Uncharacterised protein [Mycobacterium tuberculosis]